MKLVARSYRTGQPVELYVRDQRIAAIAPADVPAGQLDALPWVAPGLIDVQVNGFGGLEFDNPEMSNPEKWAHVARLLLAHGVTTILPTFCTNSQEGFVTALGWYRQAIESDPLLAHIMPGVHVEGPYISDLDGPRGAHNRAYTRDPKLEEIKQWSDACGGRLRIVTLAPERAGSPKVIRELARQGVAVAVAHTAASSEDIAAAVDAGARFSTHLGNGSHPMINRHRNYFYDQMADDRLWATVIPDSHHLPPALFKIVLRTKGLERLVFVSDSSGLAGLPPGVYGHCEILPNGRLQMCDNPQILAASSIALDFAVGKAVQMAGISLAQSIDACTEQPARLVGLGDRGRFEIGAAADLVLFNWDAQACVCSPVATYVLGEKVC